MLEKIEAAYLAVMRVVVLVAATGALLACILGVVVAAPSLGQQLGFGVVRVPISFKLALG